MEQADALDILKKLADGRDPDSDRILPPDSINQRPHVIRALFVAAEALEKAERYTRRRDTMPKKSGSPWSEDDDRRLLAAFDAGRPLQELAASHERTMMAIRARLIKYGRIAQ